jgi:ABC-type branched-subunit amino acid transport system substrate-binding protein
MSDNQRRRELTSSTEGRRELTSSSERIYHGRQLEPYRLGVLVDLPDYPGLSDVFPDVVAFALEEATARGVIEREVDVIVKEVRAQPWTDARPVVNGYRELVEEEGVLGVIGPFTTDNCLAILPDIEKLAVPTGTICGSPLFVGDFAFNLANGGLADEPAVIASWLAGEGHRRIAVLRETTQIGEEYHRFFRPACEALGIETVHEVPVYTVESQDDVVKALAACREAKPDALVYLGLGGLNQVFRPALEELGWDPPRIQTTAFVSAAYSEERARRLEGWVGVDQYDERNEVFARVLDRFEAARGYRPANSAATTGYDLGHSFAHGLGRMRIATPTGLRDAIETVRRLPACTGGPSTVITFGPQDHRGFKGADFLVLRRAVDGTTEFVGTAPVLPWEQ